MILRYILFGLLIFSVVTMASFLLSKPIREGFYFYVYPDVPPGDFLVARAWMQETEPPFRKGQGIIFRWRSRYYQFGWGRPGSAPYQPLDVSPEEIGSWGPKPEGS